MELEKRAVEEQDDCIDMRSSQDSGYDMSDDAP
jgi:hypothetical protein